MERLILLKNKQIVSYGLKNYSKKIEKDNTLTTIKMKDFDWMIKVIRGGKYISIKDRNEMISGDILACPKLGRMKVYRGGSQMTIKVSEKQESDYVIPFRKDEIENNNGKFKIKE